MSTLDDEVGGGDFTSPTWGIPEQPTQDDTRPAHSFTAWNQLMRALGHGLPAGMHRAENARRRIERMR